MVANADQSGHGQERLTGDPDTKQVRLHRARLQLLPPPPKMLAEVAVEPASSPGVRGKRRQRGRWIRTREMDAIVAQEDPEAVCTGGVADKVCTSGRSDLHTPAPVGIPCRKALAQDSRLRKIDRQQVDVRKPETYGASRDRSVDIQRCPRIGGKGDRIDQHGFEGRRHTATTRARPDRPVSRHTLVGISHLIHPCPGSLGPGSRTGWRRVPK
jgi:hypothetical protein